MNEPVTVSFDLADILIRIEDKLDKQSEEIGDIKVQLIAVKTELKGMDKRLERVENTQDTLANRREAPHYKRGGFIKP